jgi:hypothetical protein
MAFLPLVCWGWEEFLFVVGKYALHWRLFAEFTGGGFLRIDSIIKRELHCIHHEQSIQQII